MRLFLAALFTFCLISQPALAGGMSGGTGIGSLIEDISEGIQGILKLPQIKLNSDDIRRLIMRLAIYGEADLKIGDKIIHIKCRRGVASLDSTDMEYIVISIGETLPTIEEMQNPPEFEISPASE